MGDYILYVDGDDFLDKDCCQFLYKKIKHQPEIELFHFAGESYPHPDGLIYTPVLKKLANIAKLYRMFSHIRHT